jgi:hypothetical protein
MHVTKESTFAAQQAILQAPSIATTATATSFKFVSGVIKNAGFS